jgi:TonB family protein
MIRFRIITALILCLCLSVLGYAQEQSAPAVTATAVAADYPGTPEGLKLLLSDLLKAEKDGNRDKVARSLKEMEVPGYEPWFYKVFPKETADKWISDYRHALETSNESMERFLSSLASQNGVIVVRKVESASEQISGLLFCNASPLKQKGSATPCNNVTLWNQPVSIYNALWESAGSPQRTLIGSFLSLGGKFRWDSLVQVVRARTAATENKGKSKDGAPDQTDVTGEIAHKQAGGVVHPEVIYAPDPQYSIAARDSKIEGVVMLWLIVDRKGRAQEVLVRKSLGAGLDEEAIKSVRQWKFKPALENGQPIAYVMITEINFQLH